MTIVEGSYSSINTASRAYRVYYPAGTPVTAKLPVVVFIHGGGWWKGDLNADAITPAVCNNTLTIACWLAENGYVVYSIDYTLVKWSSGTDLSITSPNTVTSRSHNFTAADVGSAVIVLEGNAPAWNTGGYTIQSVVNGYATLNASPGKTGAQSGAFQFSTAGTMWPVQWQDCNCFLRYLAETLGISSPGDRNNIYLFGHSAGGHLAGVTGLSGNNAFATNCEHVSTNYTIRGIIGGSPPTDLVTMYKQTQTAFSDIRALLGCIPGYQNCNQTAATASITNYVGENLPPYISFSGVLDVGVPPINVQEASLGFAKLNPPVVSPWVLMDNHLPVNYSHDLDIAYYNPCSADPDFGSEPSPCGSAGYTFANIRAFLSPLINYVASLNITSGNYQSIMPGLTAPAPLAVSVMNQYGQAIPGISVTFTMNTGASGQGGTFNGSAIVTTDSSGVATAPALTVNGVPGPFSVTASTGGMSTSFWLNIGTLGKPFGNIDTPAGNSSGIAGAINVTGWALSPVGIQSVAIFRNPVPTEGPSLVYLVNATLVPGSRPDVARAFPGYPCNNYGWGAQVLTNELPGTSSAGVGNGTYQLHVLITDNSGNTVDIGGPAFSTANSSSLLPFGTIDTPPQGATVSGTAYVNFGWALTPQPNYIPVNGSTIWVYIDNVPVGHPVYNNYRVDIATLFPGLQNTDGAVGYYYIDTTKLTNGLHTIAWSVTDSAGHAQGMGSRYFNVQN